MKQVLIFKTGETTCSERPSYPGGMCQFMRTTNFGTQFCCGLYDMEHLRDVDGWLQRLPQCVAQHRGVSEMGEDGK